ncbi:MULTISPECIES: UDP-galactopyranose mutase [Pectobacterium]|uniref:UDP-galactopyranose mutase n=1 Tax=Pectobacterium TaxID=122277 RepID=UPI00057D0C1F|nr:MULTISPECIES: UDP-galactopyranose mutase [Pectobacterium]KHS95605.1 UDP-galactopyranose mutase [Pectobacterium parvum]UVD97755.1 UDP-galactopyranose mutase [Pectobacterium parvum]GKW41728.1 UDP-galactopyranose mutase [Pectobacterium carotovorum subsp. carotovorum]
MKNNSNNIPQYDFIIVGAGLFGAVCANELANVGMKVLVIEKRAHIGGNIYTENQDGINVHKYGAHIFHTNDKYIWDYVNNFVEFNRFTNSPLAFSNGKLYNLPFNMNTFYQIWGTVTPEEARKKIEEQRKEVKDIEPSNLEEQAISLVGRDIYETLIKSYTEKQWGRNAKNLPAFIIKRLPVRFTYDNNYFSDKYQGIPIGGYTKIIEKMLSRADVILNIDFLSSKSHYINNARNIIYTGPIDEFYEYRYGHLEYRSLRFENERHEIENYQGNAVINYSDDTTTFTRIIEHKHFENSNTLHTVITKEFPMEYKEGSTPYYPINDNKNMERFKKYKKLSENEKSIIFGGRLAEYKYYDMHQVIAAALYTTKKLINEYLSAKTNEM